MEKIFGEWPRWDAAALVVALTFLLSACGGSPTTMGGARTSSVTAIVQADCPARVEKMLEPAATDKSMKVFVDPTGSNDTTSESFKAQFTALMETAVAEHAGLSVTVFGGSSAGVSTFFECPALVPLVRSKEARERVTRRLVDRGAQEILQRFEAAKQSKTAWDHSGSDVWGAVRGAADLLESDVHNVVVVLTDGGQNVDSEKVQVKLPASTAVLMYGVGRGADGKALSTVDADALVRRWQKLLASTGASNVKVSTAHYTGGIQ